MTSADTRVAANRSSPIVSPGPPPPAADIGPHDRRAGWVMTLLMAALAAITRLLNLGSPTDAGTPVFDEKHYAPQAWQMLHNYGVEDNPGYGLIVHPPVGKQLIAAGEALFGYSGLGWRFSGAVLGIVLVALVVRIVRRISGNTLVGAIAGLLLITDGVSFVASRTALLDGFLTFFVVAAFGALIVDRDQVRERMHIALLQGRIAETVWGPRLGVRWWRWGAGVLLGLATATKWSGLFYIVFFGLMSVAFDCAARRAYGVQRPWLGVIRRDAGPTAYVFGFIPLAVYLASYGPWFASETAINRYQVGQTIGPRQWYQPPDAIRSLWHYLAKAYQFHSSLTNSAGNHHPWESKPWMWPMSLRPVLYAIDSQDVSGCGAQSCVKAMMLIGAPALWWLAVPALGYAIWRAFIRRDWRYAVILTGYCAGFLPWFVDLDRQMYFFYAVGLAPFLVMLIAMILGDIILKPPAHHRKRRTLGWLVASCYIAVVIANFIWMYPILTGIPISQTLWNNQLWLPSWR